MTTHPASETLAAGPSLDDALDAHRAFYHAFSSRDLATMDLIWARGVPVLCIHPGWPLIVGCETCSLSLARVTPPSRTTVQKWKRW